MRHFVSSVRHFRIFCNAALVLVSVHTETRRDFKDTMLSTYIVLLAMARLIGGDVSCATACTRCRNRPPRPPSELATVYCSLCRECRDRRREWLETAPPARRNVAPVNRPNRYREEAYYRKDATVYNAPGGNYPVSGCPPPPSCDDGGEFAYVKVYGLKSKKSTGCPPAPPCATTPQRPPRTRRTRAPFTLPVQPAYANQCCPMVMPMAPCMCPFGPWIFSPGAGAHGPSSATNVTSQITGDQAFTTSQSSAQTEPVYLYIGIPKDMQSLVNNQA